MCLGMLVSPKVIKLSLLTIPECEAFEKHRFALGGVEMESLLYSSLFPSSSPKKRPFFTAEPSEPPEK